MIACFLWLSSLLCNRDDNGNTTLHFACENGDEEMIGWLINRGADPISSNNDGDSTMSRLKKHSSMRTIWNRLAMFLRQEV